MNDLKNKHQNEFNTIEEAVEDIKNGKMIVIIDDFDRENEGDLVMAASLVEPEHINFITREARGLLCTPITEQRASELELDLMVEKNTALHQTRFTISIDYIHGTTTGISAQDRTLTIKALVDEKTKPEDFGRPGHIFPLISKKGGVL